MKNEGKEPSPGQTYRARECATLGGVTVRALHHYDRLGLLSPRRTSAGHRMYSVGDLEFLQLIVALKSIGIPLSDIARLRARSATVTELLGTQRLRLEERSRALARITAAVREGEEASAAGRNAGSRIMTTMGLEVSDDQWRAVVRATFEHRRSLSRRTLSSLHRQWKAILMDARQDLNDDPASPRVQALARRWVDLIQRVNGKAVPLSILMRCGESTYHHFAKRTPGVASSDWGRTVALLIEAASVVPPVSAPAPPPVQGP